MAIDADLAYVESHFWKLDELAEAVCAPVARIEALITARCAPGPIYILGQNGWWSALDRHHRSAPDGPAWYSPGAAWGLRRTLLATRAGVSDTTAAMRLEQDFSDAFIGALSETDGAELAFPTCFVRGALDISAARRTAREEWGSWLSGGYGVCLRVFTGRTCVAKEALGASLKAALAVKNYDPAELLILAEALTEIILPFAPWQRSAGTPGRTIDRLLNEQNLGSERPYARL